MRGVSTVLALMKNKLLVIAIGGNSLIKDAEHMSVLDQYGAAGETALHIAEIVKMGYRVVVTHGNGPQVGFILLRSEIAKTQVHQVPLASCVADTQGAIGYQIEQTLQNHMLKIGVDREVVTVVTQVVVDKDDPAWTNPSKPIGPFMTEEVAKHNQQKEGWKVMEDAGRGWRRVVSSPEPLEIIEMNAIRTLLDNDMVVIAVGGGGVPVIRDADGSLQGCDAVIDKDKASRVLAKELKANIFVISTAVDKVALNFGTPEEKWLDKVTLAEMKQYLDEGHFAPGSMRPKIEAAIRFLEEGGERVIITQPHLLEDALAGKTGTHVVAA